MSENLWGALPLQEMIESPASILQSQATVLNEITSGKLVGRVLRSSTPSGTVRYEFRVLVPALGNYSTTLFFVEHRLGMYPVHVARSFSEIEGGASGVHVANSAEEFKNEVRMVLQSPSVQKDVASLYQLANDETGVMPAAAGQYS